MQLTKKEKFIARLAITAIEHVPFKFVSKKQLLESDLSLIDSLMGKLSDETSENVSPLDSNERKFLIDAVDTCAREECQCLNQTGKSVGFQTYLSTNFGEIDKESFESLLEKLS
jgi:3-oxoacyl-ACP reductase-like protein